MKKKVKPEWVPDDSGDEFTTSVMPGITLESSPQKNKRLGKQDIDIDTLAQGVISGDRVLLSKSITLIESNLQAHIDKAQLLLKQLLPHSGKSVRIGITGPPGAGKSTFIEALGTYLCRNGSKVAVLAIDPSSTISKGAILGDKTRMEELSNQENAFIRPSPSGGTLGGVARKTKESIIACEAAGFDVILIETIGVGQSEITVRSMVDCFLLLLLPGSGDELQGIKKGVVELADILVINKAEGKYLERAQLTQSAYQNATQLLTPATEGWIPKVFTCSALNKTGVSEVWTAINEFLINVKSSGVFDSRRKKQVIDWIYAMIEEEIKNQFYNNKIITNLRPEIEKNVLDGIITPTQAVRELLNNYHL
ncbi:MAG: methylmalonyl Co-A mutase-associated GTPase MeaB [Ignavibacteriae bacterium HGW-Ignavibacteriae-1]|jgi:LAO/AO transport system kinase|nr:MAG: methylmalonyl Co-A mutase-associated GTPase MeaB [Ignavibacteriae bacterium HGW-Ignavibacteriae-1]